MTSVFVLLLLTSQGVYEAQGFETMRQCLEASSGIKKMETLCVERKVVNPDTEVQKMLRMFRSIKDALDKDL
jgi:hypothetical protein